MSNLQIACKRANGMDSSNLWASPLEDAGRRKDVTARGVPIPRRAHQIAVAEWDGCECRAQTGLADQTLAGPVHVQNGDFVSIDTRAEGAVGEVAPLQAQATGVCLCPAARLACDRATIEG